MKLTLKLVIVLGLLLAVTLITVTWRRSVPVQPQQTERKETFYATGELRSSSRVLDGLLNGLSEGWYTNGQLQVSEYYSNGISNGLRTKWYENGRKKSEADIVNGKLHGFYKQWAKTGELVTVARFEEDVPHGESMTFYPSGFLKVKVIMDHGKQIEMKTWDDGQHKGILSK